MIAVAVGLLLWLFAFVLVGFTVYFFSLAAEQERRQEAIDRSTFRGMEFPAHRARTLDRHQRQGFSRTFGKEEVMTKISTAVGVFVGLIMLTLGAAIIIGFLFRAAVWVWSGVFH